MLNEINEDHTVLSVQPNLYLFKVNWCRILLEVDSCSCASLLTENYCETLKLTLEETSIRLTAYGGKAIDLKGQVFAIDS